MPVSVARQIVFDVLLKVERQSAYASDLLHNELTSPMKPQDAALATELTMGVLRNARLLDFLIELYSRKPVPALDPEVGLSLRLGIYQIRFLERVPARAAINESVELVKRARKRSAAPFVNAILRRAAERSAEPAAGLIPGNLSKTERLGILWSHPTWLVERWLGRFGEARTTALLEENNRPSETAGAFLQPDERETAVRELERERVQLAPGRWLRDAFRVKTGNVSGTRTYREGRVSIQDEASQIVPLLLGVQAGDSVLDLCAAPGGKTAALARAAGYDAFVVAADIHERRLRAMRSQLKRLGQAGVRLAALDATTTLPFCKKFTRILVDAPCSGTGTLARNPEIRARLQPEDLPDLHARQSAMLKSALAYLEVGGRLVYSTCSLEPEENEQVVEEALRQTPGAHRVNRSEMMATLKPFLVSGANPSEIFDEDGAFHTLPPGSHTDGFFALGMERIK